MGDSRFRAFISYSHADEAWGAWLQRSLESYRAPKSLAAAADAIGSRTPLAPVFRDRADLPVAGNLNAAIQQALADSEFQIVLCSPSSAKSRWVNEEIKLFHKLHGPGRTFALIIGGEPGASSIKGREAEECFPPALRFELDADGNVTDAPAEPLAADAREGADGKRYGFLKVAAGMMGVGLDDLVRRDSARRARNLVAITVISATIAVVMGVSTFLAVTKGNEAAAARVEAENLIQFMLTDLKDKLEPVGKLDILESVADRATAYYAGQDLKSLDDDALARRAKAMTQLGNIEFRRNDLDSAQTAYEAAAQSTGAMLKKAPDDPDRVFDHAQSIFYLGETAIARGDLKAGEKHYEEYLRLAERLVAFDGRNPKWRLELAYATSNLGSVRHYAGDYDAAIDLFEGSIAARRALLEATPDDSRVRFDYAYAISWRALSELARGSYADAISLLKKQLQAYGAAAEPASDNFQVLDVVVTAQRRLAEAHLGLGQIDEAREANAAALATVERLIRRDPENANWNVNASHIHRMNCYLYSLRGDAEASAASSQKSLDFAKAACKHATCEEWMIQARAYALASRLSSETAIRDDAVELDRLMSSLDASRTIDNASTIATAALALSRYEMRAGNPERAAHYLADGIERVEPKAELLPAIARIRLAGLYVEAGNRRAAGPVIARLDQRGVAHPEFVALKLEIRRLAAADPE